MLNFIKFNILLRNQCKVMQNIANFNSIWDCAFKKGFSNVVQFSWYHACQCICFSYFFLVEEFHSMKSLSRSFVSLFVPSLFPKLLSQDLSGDSNWSYDITLALLLILISVSAPLRVTTFFSKFVPSWCPMVVSQVVVSRFILSL